MRIDPSEVSTRRRGWGTATDAPTFLPPDEPVVLPKRKQPQSDSVITSAPRDSRRPTKPEIRGASQSTIKPAQQAEPTPKPRVSQPLPAPPEEVPPFVQFEGGASFDPNAIPLPPELAPPVYGWLRRLALQADLQGADRLLRDAAADLTSALSVTIIYADGDGLHSLGVNDELPKDQQPIMAVAKARRALVGTHSALIPIATTNETIAVIQLARNARQPAFNMIDHVTMAALARESASIMHHLVVQHLQRRSELESDKKSLYRPEALENHRKRGQEGVVTELSPGWVRRTYQILVAAMVIAILFAVFIKVPTYSGGNGVVVFQGTPVSAPGPGTIESVAVKAGDFVRKGDIVVKLKAEKETADLEQATKELRTALEQHMYDQADENVRKQVIAAQITHKRAEDALEQRTMRAPIDGEASDIRSRINATINFGDPIMTIVPPGTEPEVLAFLPGSDAPRLKHGMPLQVDLTGYQKTRETAIITHVDTGNTGPALARQTLGPELADSLNLAPNASYVLVRAKLKKATFRAKGVEYPFHQGMPVKTEARLEQKRFIVTLLPSLEKYLP